MSVFSGTAICEIKNVQELIFFCDIFQASIPALYVELMYIILAELIHKSTVSAMDLFYTLVTVKKTLESRKMRQITVYADVLFLVNWLMDYVLLMAVAGILRLKVKKKRIMLASAVGAVWVCLITVICLPKIVEELGTFALICGLMIWIAFKPSGVKRLFSELMVLYGVAILGGGAVNVLYFHSAAGQYLRALMLGQSKTEMASVWIIPVSVIAVTAAVRLVRVYMIHCHQRNGLYTAKLFLGGNSVELTALLDTGNRLREPVTQKAVHIVEKSAVEPLDPNQKGAVRLFVPYHAVGTKAGLLVAFRIDRMELAAENGYRLMIEQPLIGLYDEKLSAKEEYQMILHTEIETRQGETL